MGRSGMTGATHRHASPPDHDGKTKLVLPARFCCPSAYRFQAFRMEERHCSDRQALRVADLPNELVDAIAAAEPPEEARRFDGEVG